MFMTNHLIGFGASAGVTSVSIGTVYTAQDASNASTYTFASVQYGTAKNNRHLVIVVQISSDGSGTISDLTVDTVSATQLLSVVATSEHMAIYIITRDTGTSGTIVATISGSPQGCAIEVYPIYDASATAYDTASDITGNPVSATINVAAGGAVIGGIIHRSDTIPTTYTWSGLTENWDGTIDGGTFPTYGSSASDIFTAVETGRTISSTASAAGVRDQTLAVVSFEPF